MESGINNPHKRVKWDDASTDDLWRYNRATDVSLSGIALPMGALACTNLHCRSNEHRNAISMCLDTVSQCLRQCGNANITAAPTSAGRPIVPGWNSIVRDKRAAAVEAFHIWKDNGRPLHGLIWEVKRRTQAAYKWAVKQCRLQEEQIRADKAASALLKSGKDFWTEICKQSTAKMQRAPTIGNSHCEQDIADDFASIYKDTFNSVSSDRDDVSFLDNVFDSVSDADRVNICVNTVTNVIKTLTKGKTAGIDGISPEHLLYASRRLHVIICMLCNSMLNHGYMPDNLMESYITPIVKNKCASLSDYSNYRPIAISSNISKVFEMCIYGQISNLVKIADNQFGFQTNLGCDMCVYVLKETVHVYVSQDSPVFCAFLDASKAFDRVNHCKLFRKLCEQNVPKCVTRLLRYWYMHQSIHVRWGKATSVSFRVTNGVRQGGVLSPLLFNIYVNELSERLNKVPAYCAIGRVRISHLFYADDLCVIAPSVQGLRLLLRECEKYGIEYDVKFNPAKSHCMYFIPPGSKITRFGDAVFCGKIIPCVRKVTYLGHAISSDMSDEEDMSRQRRILFCRGNQLARAFKNCSDEVKSALFRAYCYSIYGNALWNVFRVAALRSVKVAYNTSFRLLFGYSRYESASNFFAVHRVNCFLAVTRVSAYSLMNRVDTSKNTLVVSCRAAAAGSVLRSRWRALLWPDR